MAEKNTYHNAGNRNGPDKNTPCIFSHNDTGVNINDRGDQPNDGYKQGADNQPFQNPFSQPNAFLNGLLLYGPDRRALRRKNRKARIKRSYPAAYRHVPSGKSPYRNNPSRSASSAWVIPFSLRSIARFSAIIGFTSLIMPLF